MKPEEIDGWMSSAELAWLADQASRRNWIVEFGSYKGRSTKALAAATPGVVYAVDWWVGDMWREVLPVFMANLYEEIVAGKVGVNRMSTHAFMEKQLIWVDMVFIDASHDYESVSADIGYALSMLSGRGLLCGHDYSDGFPGVKRAVEERVPGFKLVPYTSIWYKELP